MSLAFLRLRSRLPEVAGPEARVLGGKWNDLGVLSGVLGSEPPVNQSEVSDLSRPIRGQYYLSRRPRS